MRPRSGTVPRHEPVCTALEFAWFELGRHNCPTQDAPDVDVERGNWPAKGDRQDGSGGVWADARQSLEGRKIVWHPAAVLLDDRDRRCAQRDRATVVAEAAPGPDHRRS